ncbi:Hypothetical predicted protein [Cloeon dipterum]|uniref:Uncharacterized protein n=1 Tax=Cloeon dipterum TaxID=197152 RepID=A0A8S1E0B2_9INSE|nr:Hypothetical predicted protein [Cloeon dipterum]
MAQSSNSFSSSHPSEGNGTGLKPLCSQKSQRIHPYNKNVASNRAPAIERYPTEEQLFPYQAGNGQNPQPESEQQYNNFNNGQIEGNAEQYNDYSASVMHQQEQAGQLSFQGQERNIYEAPTSQGLEKPASGHLSSLGSSHMPNHIPPPQQEPVAGSSSANSHLGPSINQNSKGISAQTVSLSPSPNIYDGYCLMCEDDFQNIVRHWLKFHKDKNSQRNSCYERSFIAHILMS